MTCANLCSGGSPLPGVTEYTPPIPLLAGAQSLTFQIIAISVTVSAYVVLRRMSEQTNDRERGEGSVGWPPEAGAPRS